MGLHFMLGSMLVALPGFMEGCSNIMIYVYDKHDELGNERPYV